ncbi:MAG TPA: acyl-CoA desaturase [Planctomycetota bacterium]|nr:acyl-CoA desaturase [Planctomycetota bacterium]
MNPLAGSIHRPTYAQGTFLVELRRRVDAYFDTNRIARRDGAALYLKSAILLTTFAAAWVALVFVAQTWWQVLPLSVLLGFVAALIGMNVQHDGGHGAFSERPWVNRWAARALDVIGGSSYLWHWKHGVLHHTYTNLEPYDTDVDVGLLGRMTPHQRRFWFHRWQRFYMWFLYGLLVIKWQIVDDWRDLVRARIGEHRVPRPRGVEAVVFVAGKLVFYAMAFVVPLLMHPLTSVLVCYAVAAGVAGIVLGIVFQLAHVVEEASFPVPAPETGRLADEWAVSQVRTTVDFARSSRVTTWLVGGLNFQVEHHLFPRISHVHYPEISKLVEETCREFHVPFAAHPTFMSAVRSHFRWLERMGAPTEPQPGPHVGV